MKTFRNFISEARKNTKWHKEFESALVKYDRKYKGNIDWDSAEYLMKQGMEPMEAAEMYHETIAEAMKDNGEPDGTGPHGRGKGPGKGRADGTGMKKKKKKTDDEKDEDEDKKDDKE